MSQQTLSLANSDGATFRSNLNNILGAINSTQKGPNAPPSPTAGSLWVDDNTPSASVWTLNIYDGSAWTAIGTFDTGTDKFWPANTGAVPSNSAGPGQCVTLSAGDNSNCTLPAGGTWTFFVLAGMTADRTLYGLTGISSGVAAGGAIVGSATYGAFWIGHAWRIA